MSGAKRTVDKIRQIVKLKLVMKRWKAIGKLNTCSSADSDSPSTRRRRGFLAVYVGPERRRFVIPTRFLNLPVFVSLLQKVEEEFGFQTRGGLVLPCEVGFFKALLKSVEKNEQRFKGLDFDELLRRFSEVGLDPCKETSSSAHGFTPLLQKARV